MDLHPWKLEPFLPTLTPAQTAKVTAWTTAIEAWLTHRYGDRITEAVEPMFVSYAADAILRRLQRENKTVAQQNIGPAGVRYTDKSALGGWFWPEEIASMDGTAGRGGIRSVRTPAPDAVRFGNRVVPPHFYSEDD
jgi:hypothetical protein